MKIQCIISYKKKYRLQNVDNLLLLLHSPREYKCVRTENCPTIWLWFPDLVCHETVNRRPVTFSRYRGVWNVICSKLLYGINIYDKRII